jgi:hypothetical protein
MIGDSEVLQASREKQELQRRIVGGASEQANDETLETNEERGISETLG